MNTTLNLILNWLKQFLNWKTTALGVVAFAAQYGTKIGIPVPADIAVYVKEAFYAGGVLVLLIGKFEDKTLWSYLQSKFGPDVQ